MVDPAVGALGPKGIGGTASIGKLENVDISKPDGKIRFSQSLLFLNSAEMDAIIGKLKGWNKKGPLVLSLPKMKTLQERAANDDVFSESGHLDYRKLRDLISLMETKGIRCVGIIEEPPEFEELTPLKQNRPQQGLPEFEELTPIPRNIPKAPQNSAGEGEQLGPVKRIEE